MKPVLVGAVLVLLSSTDVKAEVTGEVLAPELEGDTVSVGTLEDHGTEESV